MISVIVPVYNVEEYLKRCVDSLLNQDTDQAYEIVLVDDGSKDRSGAMCDEFGAAHPEKIVVVHKPNGGLSSARNEGVRHARGEWITCVDSDDYVSGQYLSRLHALREKFDADMAEAMYECLLCDACTDNCATGYNPPLFIREARTEAAVLGLLPEGVEAVLNNIEKSGNIYGAEKPSYAADKGKEVLVYVGEAAAVRAPEMVRAYLSLLDKAGVAYTVLENEPASGVMLGDLIGYTEEVRGQAAACAAERGALTSGTCVRPDCLAASRAMRRQRSALRAPSLASVLATQRGICTGTMLKTPASVHF